MSKKETTIQNESIKITVIDHDYVGKVRYFEGDIYPEDFPMINTIMKRISKYWGSENEKKKFYYVYKNTLNKLIEICKEDGGDAFDLKESEDAGDLIDNFDHSNKDHYIIEVLDGDILNVKNSLYLSNLN